MRNIFLIFSALLFFSSVSAQDTLTRPPSYCMLHYWPENMEDIDSMFFGVYCTPTTTANRNIDVISVTTLEKTCTIYGVSVALYTPTYIIETYGFNPAESDNNLPNIIDTSSEKVCERVRQYSRQGDSLYVEREIKWCYNEHPADWFFWTGYENNYSTPSWHNLIYATHHLPSVMPMYDLYFDNPFPYDIGDTLYLGVSSYSIIEHDCFSLYTMPVYSIGLGFRPWNLGIHTDLKGGFAISYDTTGLHGYYITPQVWASQSGNTVIYPIVSPPPPPAPQISIQPIEEVKVSLYPNPANDMVKITSSISMTGISVTSIDGRTIYNKPHAGKTTTMDIHSWPAGLYFITIATPAGNKVQKLLKR